LIARLIRAGQIKSVREIQTHHNGFLLCRSLGGKDDPQVDLWHELLQPGDRVLLCTDGIHGHDYTPIEDIEATVRDNVPDQTTQQLITLADKYGWPDNATAIVIEVNESDPRIAD
jgi:PPM family protein phosphatase